MVEYLMDEIDDKVWFSWEKITDLQHQCHEQAKAEGLTGHEAYFRGCRIFEQHLKKKKTYRQRQKEWFDRQTKKLAERPEIVDPLLDALQKIADGHNDPRSLAVSVLNDLGKLPNADHTPATHKR